MTSWEIEDEEGLRGLYVIVTLRLDFHMGSVECVTYHVPASQADVGDVKLEACERPVVVGGRNEIERAISVILNTTKLFPVLSTSPHSHPKYDFQKQ